MDTNTISMVQDSFKKIIPIADIAAEIFYSKLFEMAPSVRPLFKGDMKEQGKKLMSMIGVAVNGLNDLNAIVPTAQNLGKNHVKYGVKDEHYDTVGAALLATLATGLGDAFTPEVKAAWAEVYGVLASTMKDAAATVELTPAEKKKWYEFWK